MDKLTNCKYKFHYIYKNTIPNCKGFIFQRFNCSKTLITYTRSKENVECLAQLLTKQTALFGYTLIADTVLKTYC